MARSSSRRSRLPGAKPPTRPVRAQRSAPHRAVVSTAAVTHSGRAGAAPPLRVSGVLLRFVCCGLLAMASGLLWRLTLAPRRLGAGSALLGVLFLLLGFVVGGIAFYLRDARRRLRDPRLVDDERIIFSFVVFGVVPFLVLATVGAVWLLTLLLRLS